jgi:hypothetical protein
MLLHLLPLSLWLQLPKKRLQLQRLLAQWHKRLQRQAQQTLQKVLMKHQRWKTQMLKCLQSQSQKLPQSNPKQHLALLSLCAVMTAQVKNVPKLHRQVAAVMASLAANLATSQALVVMANQVAMVVVTAAVKALHRVAHV